MKKKILIMALLVSSILTSAFAGKTDVVSDRVLTSFRNEFKQAQELKWETGKRFAKVTFKLNEQVMFGYYEENGKLLALVRNIVTNQLPINLMTTVLTNLDGYWITDLFEVAAAESRSYFVTIRNADNTLVLKSEDGGAWQLYKKTKDVD